jgi:hypothetical protein
MPTSNVYLFFNPKYMRTKGNANMEMANHCTVQLAEYCETAELLKEYARPIYHHKSS